MESLKPTNITTFVGGKSGDWKTTSVTTLKGPILTTAPFVDIVQYESDSLSASWKLKGVKSNLRYTTRPEKQVLDQSPSVLGKEENTFAALIPLKKAEEWWMLTQDERRKIFEEDSRHIEIGSKYLRLVSRQLYHSRDLGEEFDFLTWFEFAPPNKGAFEELLDSLRMTEEWKYVIREVDFRLEKA